jgi:hypothetical protein
MPQLALAMDFRHQAFLLKVEDLLRFGFFQVLSDSFNMLLRLAQM